jgi:hypothetical protein
MDDAALPPVGAQATVRVAAATLWARPEAVRPVLDDTALATPTDLAGWVAGLDAGQRMGDGVLSQLLLGEKVLVQQVRPDGWARVVAVEQPAGRRDPRGYPGWLPTAHLTPAVDPPRPGGGPLVVAVPVTALSGAPDGPVVLPGVTLGTRLTAAGPARRGWRPVHAAGHREPLWAPVTHLAPLPAAPADPTGPPPDPAGPLAAAGALAGVPYVWGGLSGHGVDCSGLVHLAWRRFGVRLPRDAADQAEATTAVPLGTETPGDLYVFARPDRPIHHIGIVSAAARPGRPRRMLHACYTRGLVLEEELPPERTATLVGVRRVG